MMDIKAKTFCDLTAKELYEILRVRAEIFVVEQNCVYLDPDGKDYDALHVFIEEDGRILAYFRAFQISDDIVQLGRVLTVQRGKGLGGDLLREGIRQIRERFDPGTVYIEAQCYATGFYEKAGFTVSSEEFLEDGIPHVQMLLKLN